MDDFVVRAMAKDCDDFFRSSAGNPPQFVGAVVRESAGEFLTIFAAEGNDVALLKVAFDPRDSDRQQASALLLDGLLGTGVKTKPATGLRREANPAFARCDGRSLCQE